MYSLDKCPPTYWVFLAEVIKEQHQINKQRQHKALSPKEHMAYMIGAANPYVYLSL